MTPNTINFLSASDPPPSLTCLLPSIHPSFPRSAKSYVCLPWMRHHAGFGQYKKEQKHPHVLVLRFSGKGSQKYRYKIAILRSPMKENYAVLWAWLVRKLREGGPEECNGVKIRRMGHAKEHRRDGTCKDFPLSLLGCSGSHSLSLGQQKGAHVICTVCQQCYPFFCSYPLDISYSSIK